MKKKYNLLFTILFLILELYILSHSNIVISDFVDSLNNCIYNLMPTMFSSILITQILIELEMEKYIPNCIINFISKLFKITNKDSIIFLFSIISGYPNNAKMLNNNPNLDKLIIFTNFVNPIFLISTVGIIYLNNVKLSYVILISHYLSNIILGIIVRNKNIYEINDKRSEKNKKIFDIYFNALKNTMISLCNIFSNILFFSILLSLLKNILPFNNTINSIITGIFEFSNGIYEISFLNISEFLKGLLILITITFSSFSIHMQQISVNNKIKYINYLFYRIINVFISIITFIILYIVILH